MALDIARWWITDCVLCKWTDLLGGLVLPLFVSGVGALAGALAAFRLESRARIRRERQVARGRLNRAIQMFGLQLNYLVLLQCYLDRTRDRLGVCRALTTRPVHAGRSEQDRMRVDDLSFMLGSDFTNLVGEVMAADQNFALVCSIVEERGRMHREEVHHRLEENGFIEGMQMSPKDAEPHFRRMLGERLYHAFVGLTDDMFTSVDKARGRHGELIQKMSDAGRRFFPGEKVIRLSVADRPDPGGS